MLQIFDDRDGVACLSRLPIFRVFPFREDPCCCVNVKRLAAILPLTRGKYYPHPGDVSAVRHPCVYDVAVLLLWRNLGSSESRKDFAIASMTSSVPRSEILSVIL